MTGNVRSSRSALAFLLAVMLPLSGCATSWQTQSVAPAAALDRGDTDVRILLSSGAKVRLRDPAVVGDSLIGWVAQPGSDTSAVERRAFPIDQVEAVSLRKNNVGLNIGLGVLIGGALFMGSILGTYAIVCSGGGCD